MYSSIHVFEFSLYNFNLTIHSWSMLFIYVYICYAIVYLFKHSFILPVHLLTNPSINEKLHLFQFIRHTTSITITQLPISLTINPITYTLTHSFFLIYLHPHRCMCLSVSVSIGHYTVSGPSLSLLPSAKLSPASFKDEKVIPKRSRKRESERRREGKGWRGKDRRSSWIVFLCIIPSLIPSIGSRPHHSHSQYYRYLLPTFHCTIFSLIQVVQVVSVVSVVITNSLRRVCCCLCSLVFHRLIPLVRNSTISPVSPQISPHLVSFAPHR